MVIAIQRWPSVYRCLHSGLATWVQSLETHKCERDRAYKITCHLTSKHLHACPHTCSTHAHTIWGIQWEIHAAWRPRHLIKLTGPNFTLKVTLVNCGKAHRSWSLLLSVAVLTHQSFPRQKLIKCYVEGPSRKLALKGHLGMEISR